jgi:uncharacterized repeat protein (TIGR01451 family)
MSYRPRGLRRAASAAFLFLLSSWLPVRAAERIELVSRALPGLVSETSGYQSTFPLSSGVVRQTVSADGRYVVFSSVSSNLIPGQVENNIGADIFLHDRVAGTITLVSHNVANPNATGNSGSSNPSISADGRYVAFSSTASTLRGADFNSADDVFVFDRDTGVVTLVSHAAGAADSAAGNLSFNPMISADGNWVVYQSRAANLVAGQVNDFTNNDDIFLWERATNTNILVSHAATSTTTDANSASSVPAVNADGSWVAYTTFASDLVDGVTDFNGQSDIYLWERAANANQLVSRSGASATATTAGNSQHVRISADGATLLFLSQAADLVTGQTDGNSGGFDAFLYDRGTGELTLVSHSAGSATTAGNGALIDTASLSADGNWVAFSSPGSDYVSGQSDTNGTDDVFLWSRATNTLELVTRRPGLAATASASTANFTYNAEVSAGGAFVAYVTRATQLVTGQTDTNGAADAFLFTRATGTNALLSGAGGSAATTADALSRTPVFSADGKWLAFVTTASDVIPGLIDTNDAEDVLLHDRIAGTTSLVSRRDAASPSVVAAGPSIVPFVVGSGLHPLPALSADGRYLAFQSATNRLIPGQVDRNAAGYDVFHYDRWTGTLTLVSRAAGTTTTTGNAASQLPAISADGRWVAFLSRATNLIAGQLDANNADDVFLWDSQTGAMTLVSRTAASAVTAAGTVAPGAPPVINANGAWVGFLSNATNVVTGQVDLGSSADLFLFDRANGTNTLVSHTRSGLLNAANSASEPLISADGATVAFLSSSSIMVTGQTDPGGNDLFLWDRATGAITLVSHGSAATTTAVGASNPGLSADGNWLAFTSLSNAVISGLTDTNSAQDIFLWDRATGTRTLVSHSAASATTAANQFSQGVVLSADGSRLAFLSRATNLVTGQTDTNNALDVFVFQRSNGQIALASHAASGTTTAANGASVKVAISADGSRVTFLNAATNLVSGQTDTASTNDVFSFEVATGAVKLLSYRHTSAAAGLTVSSEMTTPSADGRVVAFTTPDGNVVPNDHNARYDVFLWMADSLSDLRITKTDDRESAIPGEGVIYTITATNLGPYPTTATVADAFPAALQGISWSCAASGGATCSLTGTGALSDAVSLPVNGTVIYTVNATIAADATGTLDNTATVAVPSGVLDPVAGNNSATDSDTLTPWADLAVTLSGSPDPVERGAQLTYTIEVDNHGPSNAAMISVAQTLPAGVTFGGAAGIGWSCDGGAAGVVTCTRPSLAQGSSSPLTELTVVVTAPVARGIATLSSSVTVSSEPGQGSWDSIPGTNTANAVTSVPQPGITVAPTADLVTTEAGGTGTFTVVLDTAPLADVTIALTSSDTGEGTVDPASLTFTTGNWNTPQTVTVTGADDAFVDGDASYTLQTGAASSTDAGYDGIDPADVTATNEDDDTAGIQVTPTADLVTTEAGGTDTFTVVLASRPSQDVTIALESSDTTEGQPSPTSLTFTSEDWDTPQTVTVTGVDDDLTDGDVAYTIVLQAAQSADPAFNGLDPADVAATNQDDASEGTYFTVASCRLLDTRRPEDGPALVNGEIGMLSVHGDCGVPSTARAVAVNVTAVGGDDAGHLLIYPGDLAEAPVATFLPVRGRRNTALFTVMPLAADGSGTLALEPRLAPTEMTPMVHVIVDVMGYFE